LPSWIRISLFCRAGSGSLYFAELDPDQHVDADLDSDPHLDTDVDLDLHFEADLDQDLHMLMPI
jgi:hypothetical protein